MNNAAISNDEGQSVDADLDLVKESLEANLFGAWRLCEMASLYAAQRLRADRQRLDGARRPGGHGWRLPGYRVSKTALNARIASWPPTAGARILVNAVNPGGCRPTWAVQAPRAPSSAEALVWAATLPNSGPSGGFFQDRRPVPW